MPVHHLHVMPDSAVRCNLRSYLLPLRLSTTTKFDPRQPSARNNEEMIHKDYDYFPSKLMLSFSSRGDMSCHAYLIGIVCFFGQTGIAQATDGQPKWQAVTTPKSEHVHFYLDKASIQKAAPITSVRLSLPKARLPISLPLITAFAENGSAWLKPARHLQVVPPEQQWRPLYFGGGYYRRARRDNP